MPVGLVYSMGPGKTSEGNKRSGSQRVPHAKAWNFLNRGEPGYFCFALRADEESGGGWGPQVEIVGMWAVGCDQLQNTSGVLQVVPVCCPTNSEPLPPVTEVAL